MKGSVFLGGSLALATLLASGSASAQGFNVNRYEPSERGSDWFANESLDLRGRVRPAFGVVGDYQYRPLAIHRDDVVVKSVVRNQLNAHVGGSIVLVDRLRLAASLPVVLFTDGHA